MSTSLHFDVIDDEGNRVVFPHLRYFYLNCTKFQKGMLSRLAIDVLSHLDVLLKERKLVDYYPEHYEMIPL